MQSIDGHLFERACCSIGNNGSRVLDMGSCAYMFIVLPKVAEGLLGLPAPPEARREDMEEMLETIQIWKG